MALVYEKIVGDKVVILEPREACIRIPLASANPWTELRIGIALSLTSVADSNAAYPSESFVASTIYDRFAFGLKNSDNDDLPGLAGTRFWGWLSTNGNTQVLTHTTGQFNMGASFATNAIAEGATISSSNPNPSAQPFFGTATEVQASTLFAAFWGLQIIISNRGTSTQTVVIYGSDEGHANKTDCSEAALRSWLTNFASHRGQTSGSLTANNGVVAYDVPDAFFFRFPMLNSRVRLHNVMVMQAVP